MHVDDVSADRHMDCHGNTEAMRRTSQASVTEPWLARGQMIANCLAQAATTFCAAADRVVQLKSRLVGHPETTGAQ
jgi:hypothetical protein